MTERDKVDRFVIVDVETSGLSPFRGHRIIEIGAVTVENEFPTHVGMNRNR